MRNIKLETYITKAEHVYYRLKDSKDFANLTDREKTAILETLGNPLREFCKRETLHRLMNYIELTHITEDKLEECIDSVEDVFTNNEMLHDTLDSNLKETLDYPIEFYEIIAPYETRDYECVEDRVVEFDGYCVETNAPKEEIKNAIAFYKEATHKITMGYFSCDLDILLAYLRYHGYHVDETVNPKEVYEL